MPERPRIVVTRDLPGPALGQLGQASDLWVSPQDRVLEPEELHAAVQGADAVVCMLGDRIDGPALDAAGPQLRVVANVAVGYDNLDLDAAAARGVVLTNTPGVLTDATADLALGLILTSTRRIAEGDRLLRAQRPWSWSMTFMLGTGLQGKTLGVVGLGAIGRAVADRGVAFGMNVVYTARRPRRPDEAPAGARHVSLDELLAIADVVSIHTPLSDETRGLIDARALAQMKPSACLINTARGPIVDEAALAAALADGTIAWAGLDVFEHEPDVHPGLLDLENVVLVPHLGSATVETREAMATLAAENALAVATGGAPLTPVSR